MKRVGQGMSRMKDHGIESLWIIRLNGFGDEGNLMHMQNVRNYDVSLLTRTFQVRNGS